MAQGLRFAKSAKGTAEIGERRNNLRGKLRIMLILVDPTKTAEQLRLQAAKIGAPAETLEMLQRDGYIEPTGPALVDANGYAGARDAPPVPDEAARFGKAKGFMNETLAAGLGVRAAELQHRSNAAAPVPNSRICCRNTKQRLLACRGMRRPTCWRRACGSSRLTNPRLHCAAATLARRDPACLDAVDEGQRKTARPQPTIAVCASC